MSTCVSFLRRSLPIVAAYSLALIPSSLRADLLSPGDFTSLGTLNLSSGNITIDTDALTISGAADFNGVADNQGETADSLGGVSGELGIPEVAVFTFDSINLTGTASITVTGTRALALLSHGDAMIDVTLSVNGEGDAAPDVNGSSNAGGPGGFAGGVGANPGVGPGGGGFSQTGTGLVRGASGGFGSEGYDGASNNIVGAAGAAYGDLLSVIQGGSGGGGAANTVINPVAVAGGGGGGGALEVGAIGAVTIGPSGVLDASGGIGDDVSGNFSTTRFGGSGSGGGIRVHGSGVTSQGVIRAKGGADISSQIPGGGGRVLVTPLASYVIGDPLSPSALTQLGVDVSPGDNPGFAVNYGVVTVANSVTIVPGVQTFELGSIIVLQSSSTTQPEVEILARSVQVTGAGELTVPVGGYTNEFTIDLQSPFASITGSDSLTNRKELRGTGSVEVAVVNAPSGEINTVNDQLTFTEAVTNSAGAQVNAINSTLTFPGDGLPTSGGGDNSDGLINDGNLTLVGTTVNGDVHSPGGSNIFAGGTGVVFNGLVSGGANFPGVGAVTFNGGYAPGDSPASVELGGDVNFGSGNTLFVELGGTTQGSFDQLLVSGVVSLSGSLEITLINNFPPTLGDTFEIITATGGVTGEFDNVTLPGTGYELSYSPTAVTVIATSGLAGDYNNDGIVDAADYTVWRDALTAGATGLLNDSTPGTVDESDFLYWRAHFGQSLGSGAGADENAAVPEPASALLLMLGIIEGIRRQRRIVSRVSLTR